MRGISGARGPARWDRDVDLVSPEFPGIYDGGVAQAMLAWRDAARESQAMLARRDAAREGHVFLSAGPPGSATSFRWPWDTPGFPRWSRFRGPGSS